MLYLIINSECLWWNLENAFRIFLIILNIRTDSSKTNKLRNIYTIGRRVRNISIKKWEIYYFKIKVIPFIINLKETMQFVIDKFRFENGVSVSEEFALFN